MLHLGGLMLTNGDKKPAYMGLRSDLCVIKCRLMDPHLTLHPSVEGKPITGYVYYRPILNIYYYKDKLLY